MTRIGRPVLMAAAVALAVAACGGDTATTTTAPITTTAATVPVTTTTTTTVETTTTTTLPEDPVLAREGDTSQTVFALQFLVDCAGYADLIPDGSFGLGTTASVQAAQTALGFEPTGLPTENLFAALSRICLERRTIEVGADPLDVVGHVTLDDHEEFVIPLLAGSTLTVAPSVGVNVLVKDPLGNPLASEDGVTFGVLASGNHTIEVGAVGEPVLFTLRVEVGTGSAAGDWIITTDGIAYKGAKFTLGTAAGPMIPKIFEFLGHNVRGDYNEFDTGWNDPDQVGVRGIFIEGLAFLFLGPNTSYPGRAEHFARVRYVGPSFDVNDLPRPTGWVRTLSGITVGNTLAELKTTYGTGVQPGSTGSEHYYRYGAGDGSEVCFYFGKTAPTDASPITEISTECRG